MTSIDTLLNPKSVAVVGASADPGKPSGMVLGFLERSGYAGEVYPINPRYQSIRNWRCYPTLSDAPTPPDIAVIAVPVAHVVQVAEECVQSGVAHAVVMTGGFGEGATGEEGEQRRDQLLAMARRGGMRIVGPNTVGIVSFPQMLPLTFADWYGRDTGARDRVAVLTHSGSMGGLIFSLLQANRIGVNYWVGLGNEADLEVSDFVEAFSQRADVDTVVCFLEGLKDGRRFMHAVDQLRSNGKNIIVLKAGRSAASQRSTLSHTGKLSSSANVYSAIFKKLGVVEVGSLQELAYVMRLLKAGVRMGSKAVGIISASGGACSMMADHADAAGLELPELPLSIQEKLQPVIPTYGSARNPVDLSADVIHREPILTGTLEVVATDVTVGTWIVFGRPIIDRYHELIGGWSNGRPTQLIACSGVEPAAEVADSFAKSRVPLLTDPELCMRALGRLAAIGPLSPTTVQSAKPARRVLSPRIADAQRVHESLVRRDIPVSKSWFWPTLDDLVQAAHHDVFRFTYPVAVKIASGRIPHKTEAGCVELGIAGPDALVDAAGRVFENARRLAPLDELSIEVQEMVPPGRDVLISISQDRDFGGIVVVGLGGVEAEVWKDTAVLPFPTSRDRFIDALTTLRGWPLLAGFRGAPAADLDALGRLWEQLAEFYDDEEWVGEIELNPVIVGGPSRVSLVDVLVTLAE